MIGKLKRWIYDMAAKSSTGQSAAMLAQENDGLRRANEILANRANSFYIALLSAKRTIEAEYGAYASHEIAYKSFAYAVILAGIGENAGRPFAANESNPIKKCNLSDRVEAAYIAAKNGKAAQDIYKEIYIHRKEQGAVYQLHGVGR